MAALPWCDERKCCRIRHIPLGGFSSLFCGEAFSSPAILQTVLSCSVSSPGSLLLFIFLLTEDRRLPKEGGWYWFCLLLLNEWGQRRNLAPARRCQARGLLCCWAAPGETTAPPGAIHLSRESPSQQTVPSAFARSTPASTHCSRVSPLCQPQLNAGVWVKTIVGCCAHLQGLAFKPRKVHSSTTEGDFTSPSAEGQFCHRRTSQRVESSLEDLLYLWICSETTA